MMPEETRETALTIGGRQQRRAAAAGAAAIGLILLVRWLWPAQESPRRDFLCLATALSNGQPLQRRHLAVCSAPLFCPLPQAVPIEAASRIEGLSLLADLPPGAPLLWPLLRPSTVAPAGPGGKRWIPLPQEAAPGPWPAEGARLDLYAILPAAEGSSQTVPLLQDIEARYFEPGGLQAALTHYQSVLLWQALERGKIKIVRRRDGDRSRLPLLPRPRLEQLLGPLPQPDGPGQPIEIVVAPSPSPPRSSPR